MSDTDSPSGNTAERQFREFADAMPHILWTADADGVIDYVNRTYIAYTGVNLDVAAQSWVEALHPEDVERCSAVWRNAVETGSIYSTEFRIFHKPTGGYRWNAVTAQPVRSGDGRVRKWYGVATDIHDTRVNAEKASYLGHRLESTLESMTDCFILLDHQWRVAYVNRAAEKALQRPRSALLGKVLWEEFGGMVDSRVYRECHRILAEGGSSEFEYVSPFFERWLEVKLYSTGEGISIYFSDITRRKEAEKEIERLAFHDQLTGLPNRELLHDRLRHAVLMSGHSSKWGGLMFIDLDNFKMLNDTKGHGMGDLLLQQVANRLVRCVRGSDTVARFAGDEFLVILEEIGPDPESAAIHAEMIGEKILAALNLPYDLGGYVHNCTPSIGIALFDGQAGDIGELLKRADLAMYRAKAAGKNAIRFYDPEMQAAVSAKRALEAGLRESLRNGWFVLHYQPQIGKDNCITGAEALVRWTHPLHKDVPPSVFIPVAEETGLILELGHWVLETACAQLAEWNRNPETAQLSLSVNVSAHQFHHRDFVRQVLEAVRTTGANPARLKLELTETVMVKDIEDAVTKINALNAHGIRFSLDDFGTGYSSLSYLRDMPLEQLKIDRSFIHRLPGNANDTAIVQAIIAMGHNLGFTIVAEGVETEPQLEFLARNDCNVYQGFLFLRPVIASELTAYIRGRNEQGKSACDEMRQV